MRDRIKELGLLEQTWRSPIDRQLVAQVRAIIKGASVAQAAAAIGAYGNDLESACEHVREELGLPATETALDTEPARDLNDDALLRELQRRLKVRSSAPALKTIAVAVDLCRNEELDFVAACAAYGISIASQRKAVYERVAAIRDRIKELNLLEAVEQGLPDPLDEDGAERDGAATSSSAAGPEPSPKRALPLDDVVWLSRLQERVGPLVSRFNGQKKEPPTLPSIAAAVEMCQISQLDLAALCIKHGIPVEAERSNLALFSHLRELRDRIKTLALLEVAPETLGLDAPHHSQEKLISLQLRIQRSTTPPNLDNIAVALDLVEGDGQLDLVSACVRRRLELSQSRKDSIEALRVRIRQLEEPLDAPVDPTAVAEVRARIKRSGVDKGATVAQAAAAIVACGTDLDAACDHVREQLGLSPASEELEEVNAEDGGEGSPSDEPFEPREDKPPPPPLPEALLRELQRRIALHKKTHVLTGLHLIAAAADLCRDDQPARWDQLDVAAVCARHGISLGNQRKATFDKLKDLRDRMRGFGPLEQLVTPVELPSTDDDVLLHDIQLLLQTSNGNGGASRPACAIKTIAVAVEMARDSHLDFDAACAKHQIPGVGSSARSGVFDRIAAVRDRIKELGLLEQTWRSPIDRQLVAQVRALIKGASVAQAAAAIGAYGNDLESACEHVREELAVKEAREAEEAAAAAQRAKEAVAAAVSSAGETGSGGRSRSSGKGPMAACAASSGLGASSSAAGMAALSQQSLVPDGWSDEDEVGAWAAADAARLVAEMNGDGDDDEGWADPTFFSGCDADEATHTVAPIVAVPFLDPNIPVAPSAAAAASSRGSPTSSAGSGALGKRARKEEELTLLSNVGNATQEQAVADALDGDGDDELPAFEEPAVHGAETPQNGTAAIKRSTSEALDEEQVDTGEAKMARLS